MLKTPLHKLHEEAGAKFAPFAGYDMPIQYKGILAEHNHVRQSAGLFDVSHMGQVFIKADDTAKQLERIVPADIQSLEPGQMRYTMFLNDKGGTLDDAIVTRLDNEFYLVVNASRKNEDYELLKTVFPENVLNMQDNALLALQGPKAEEVLVEFMPSCRDMKFMTAKRDKIKDIPVLVTRSGYTGEDGFEISLPADRAEELAKLLLSDDSVMWIGLGARDTLRLEAGLCLYGHELDETTTPVEAGLNWTIGKQRRTNANFAGGAVVKQQIEQGASKKRVGIKLEGRAPAREGTKIFDGQQNQIGIVTSGTFSPTLNSPIAMGYVETKFSNPGTDVQLQIRDSFHKAQIVKLPFVPHQYKQG